MTKSESESRSGSGSHFHWRKLFSGETLSPEQISNRSKWIESLVIPLLAIGIAWLASPADPLLRGAAFPWLWFAPVLVALRYGVLPGLIGGMLMLANWFVVDAMSISGTGDFPREYFFGGGLIILICGEFSDVWRDRLLRIDETNLYLIERLSGLTKRHLLLNLSHDRLEQEMLARPGSLRDAMVRLRDVVIESGAATEGMPGTESLLQLLAQYVNIEAAALYVAHEEGGHFTLGRMIGELGDPLSLLPDDELLQLAIETGNLTHIASSDLSLHSNQLVVAPLVASDNSLIGVLAVSRMPFFSLGVENLQMMSVMLAYYANNIHTAPQVHDIGQRIPGIPVEFAEEFARLMLMQNKFNIASHMSVMVFRGPRRADIPDEFLRIKRGLDIYWQTLVEGNPAVVVLMPFASHSAKDGFLERIESWMKTRFGGGFDILEIDIRSIGFADTNPVEAFARIVRK